MGAYTYVLDLRLNYAYTESMPLTPKQQAFLEFIAQFKDQHGFAPSQTEIAEHFGFRSLGTVQKYLGYLKEQGLLEPAPAHTRRGVIARSQSITPERNRPAPPTSLPLLGRVAAGRPIEAIEDAASIEVPPSWIRGGEYFTLQVSGDSMIEEGILDGDFVVVKKQKSAERGQVVVALVDGGATLKRFYPQKTQIELRPANSEYRPIVVMPHQSFQIEGILAGVIRKVSSMD